MFPMEDASAPGAPLALSARERAVLGALAVGRTDGEAAEHLGLALGSIRTYRRRAEAKLGVKGLAPCLLVAWRLGEIDLEALAEETMGRRGRKAPPE